MMCEFWLKMSKLTLWYESVKSVKFFEKEQKFDKKIHQQNGGLKITYDVWILTKKFQISGNSL